jgi:hypothetical protein
LLEAATIVGQPRDKLRVALTTQERALVRKKKLFQKPQYFLVVDGYDPRIHALYFCPQLYRKEDADLVPLSGQEIGQLMAQALEGGAVEKSPWYGPSDSMPEEPVVGSAPRFEFDSLVVDSPSARANEPTVLRTSGTREKTIEPQRCQACLGIRLPFNVTIAASRSAFE